MPIKNIESKYAFRSEYPVGAYVAPDVDTSESSRHVIKGQIIGYKRDCIVVHIIEADHPAWVGKDKAWFWWRFHVIHSASCGLNSGMFA